MAHGGIIAHAMELLGFLEACSTFERRGITFYRRFAGRFHDPPEASRLWTKMSDMEAGHFAILTLSQDLVQMSRVTLRRRSPPPLLTRRNERLAALESQGETSSLTLAEAVHLAVAWEEIELPRVLALLPALPLEARRRMLSGLLAETDLHYDCLKALAGLAGVVSIDSQLQTLRQTARPPGRRSASHSTCPAPAARPTTSWITTGPTPGVL